MNMTQVTLDTGYIGHCVNFALSPLKNIENCTFKKFALSPLKVDKFKTLQGLVTGVVLCCVVLNI